MNTLLQTCVGMFSSFGLVVVVVALVLSIGKAGVVVVVPLPLLEGFDVKVLETVLKPGFVSVAIVMVGTLEL